MVDGQAPKVFVSYAHDSETHKAQVRRLAEVLHADIGLDVSLDQWEDSSRVDWSLWAGEKLQQDGFVVVVGSPQYKRRAEGLAAADEGRGSQYENMIIRNALTKDLRQAMSRILPVLLPGRSAEDLPAFLAPYSATRYPVDEISVDGVADLVRAITGESLHPEPARGVWRGVPRPKKSARLVLAAQGWTGSGGVHPGEARIGGVEYRDSIVFRPKRGPAGVGSIEVELGGRYQRLTAQAGVLDDAREVFQVGHFRLVFDGRARPTVTVAVGKPAEVDVDVSGVSVLRLEMWREGSGGLPDLAWGDPVAD